MSIKRVKKLALKKERKLRPLILAFTYAQKRKNNKSEVCAQYERNDYSNHNAPFTEFISIIRFFMHKSF